MDMLSRNYDDRVETIERDEQLLDFRKILESCWILSLGGRISLGIISEVYIYPASPTRRHLFSPFFTIGNKFH